RTAPLPPWPPAITASRSRGRYAAATSTAPSSIPKNPAIPACACSRRLPNCNEGTVMKLSTAIDLRGGQAVRLYQGDYDQMTVYNADPVAQARAFIDAGAKYLHVVDLDGAKDDTTANLQTIAAIAKLGGLKIEVGGGIRDEER